DRVMLLELAVRLHAVDAEPPASSDWHRVGLIAPDQCPDAFAVDIDMYRSRRSHLAAARKFCPFATRDRGAATVGQAPYRAIGIAARRLRQADHTARKQCRDGAQRHPSSSNCLRHDASLFFWSIRLKPAHAFLATGTGTPAIFTLKEPRLSRVQK